MLAPHPRPGGAESSKYSEALQEAALAAGKRNAAAEDAANAAFEASSSARVKALRQAAESMARDLGTFRSAQHFAWLAAKDKVLGHHEAEQDLQDRFQAALGEETRLLAVDMAREVSLYGLALSQSTATLAHDLGQPNPGEPQALAPPAVALRPVSAENDLRANAVQGTMILPIDIAGVYLSRRPLANVAERGAAIAGRTFARAIAKEGTAPLIAAADGPLPIGDIVSVVFLAWGAVDVWRAKSDWGDAMQREAQAFVDDIADSARKSTTQHILAAKTAELKRQQSILDSAVHEGARKT